jgi:hypothetical protein
VKILNQGTPPVPHEPAWWIGFQASCKCKTRIMIEEGDIVTMHRDAEALIVGHDPVTGFVQCVSVNCPNCCEPIFIQRPTNENG